MTSKSKTTTMNTVSISAGYKGLSEEQVNEVLPFTGRTVSIDHIQYPKTGYGHWQLVLDITVDGESIKLKKTTTDSVMIDNMSDDEDEVSDAAYADAILFVLRRCEDEIADTVQNIA